MAQSLYPMSDAPMPQRLGKYRLVRRLAVGGMAEVYLAVAEGLSGFAKQVVIKRLLPQHAREQDLLAMFVDEARLLARLRHPNIAEVYDVGQEGDEIYIALEFVDGLDLRDLLQAARGPLPLPEALWITIAIAEGLHHAHELDEASPDGKRKSLGIVHRDVSPSNVLCARDGTVKLIDFGVAKWTAQMSETRHGTVKGKLHYLSPEQCRSGTIDRRSDVFALGVVLYELSTGQRPFQGTTDFDVLAAIVAGRYAPPAQHAKDYPAALDAVVVRALAAEPDERFATARAFADALRDCARALGLELSGTALGARVRAQVQAARSSADAPKDVDVEGAAADVRAARGRVEPLERTVTEAAPRANAAATRAPEAAVGVAKEARGSAPATQRKRMTLALVALALVGAGAVLLILGQRGAHEPEARPSRGSAAATPTVQARPGQPATVDRAANPPAPSAPERAAESGVRTNLRDGRGASGLERRAATRLPAQATAAVTTREPPPPAPPPAPEAPPTPARPPAPVKVWDPDSPIPP